MSDEVKGDTETVIGEQIGTYIHFPKPIWKWDVFGGSLIVTELPYEVSIWRRILTRIFLGSKWKRINDQKS